MKMAQSTYDQILTEKYFIRYNLNIGSNVACLQEVFSATVSGFLPTFNCVIWYIKQDYHCRSRGRKPNSRYQPFSFVYGIFKNEIE